jgi:hypothetical protein
MKRKNSLVESLYNERSINLLKMAITQSQFDDLASIQSQLIQIGGQVQSITAQSNSLPTSKPLIQSNLKTIQASINTINRELGKQLMKKPIR